MCKVLNDSCQDDNTMVGIGEFLLAECAIDDASSVPDEAVELPDHQRGG